MPEADASPCLGDSCADRAARLERCERDLRQLAHVVSHDLSEPLRIMSGYADLLQRRSADALDERGRRYVDAIGDGARQLQAQIDALLRWSRAGARPLTLSEVDADSVLDSVLAELEPDLRERDAVIVRGPLPTLVADATRLADVLRELIGNALRFCEGPPRVEIRARRTANEWMLSVTDSGIGIAADRQDRAFELFQRLQARETGGGEGIGLTLARDAVRAHGGEMTMRSNAGVGTTVSFSVPVGLVADRAG